MAMAQCQGAVPGEVPDRPGKVLVEDLSLFSVSEDEDVLLRLNGLLLVIFHLGGHLLVVLLDPDKFRNVPEMVISS